jgi:Tol biopolymer transport system component
MKDFALVSKIAFVSNRDDPTGDLFRTAEIYLMDPDDPLHPHRLTNNTYGDGFPMLSPDGKHIVFDSNRLTWTPEIPNISDLFVIDADGENETWLTRGTSASWSPDSKDIVFHASDLYYDSGGTRTELPIRGDPGAPTVDSDLFVANVDDLAAAETILAKTQLVTNITNTPDQIEEDADWSAGGQIVFASHFVDDPLTETELYVINPDGTGRLQLTDNDYEERGASWSPDGTQIVFMARGADLGPNFEICVINADGTGFQQLTDNTVGDLTPSWSPDGTQILFQRPGNAAIAELWIMNSDGTGQMQLTDTPGFNSGAQWGVVRDYPLFGDDLLV